MIIVIGTITTKLIIKEKERYLKKNSSFKFDSNHPVGLIYCNKL